MSKDTIQTFRQFCEEKLSQQEFNSLDERLETSQYRITWLLNNPTRFPLRELLRIAVVLGVSPMDLVENYECGLDEMTARIYRNLLAFCITD